MANRLIAILLSAATLLTPVAAHAQEEELETVPENTAYVRLTYYVLRGKTANGENVHLGGTACSKNWPMGTRFRLPDGSVVTCNDRGLLGSSGWLDVWGRSDLNGYATVEVLDANP